MKWLIKLEAENHLKCKYSPVDNKHLRPLIRLKDAYFNAEIDVLLNE